MHLKFRNVNDAFRSLVAHFHNWDTAPAYMENAGRDGRTVRKSSRYGDVRMIEEPVLVTYSHPRERVLFNAARDCNPFFHLYESLWMLAGRNDVAPLTYYTSKIADIASDDGKTFNGAYGYRWRNGPYLGKGTDYPRGRVDQLDLLVSHLKAKPDSRRAVLQMWNVEDDLLKIDSSKDVCCNTSVMFSLRRTGYVMGFTGANSGPLYALDMTVTNRSNDMVWGMLGANYVHFSFLQEYMAARLGASVGVYNHFSNNLHCYDKTWEPEKWLAVDEMTECVGDTYPKNSNLFPLVSDPATFEKELPTFVEEFDGTREIPAGKWDEPFFNNVAAPMLTAFHRHKQKKSDAIEWCETIKADDWRIAATEWIRRRVKNADSKR
jgi:thymidylate synthase